MVGQNWPKGGARLSVLLSHMPAQERTYILGSSHPRWLPPTPQNLRSHSLFLCLGVVTLDTEVRSLLHFVSQVPYLIKVIVGKTKVTGLRRRIPSAPDPATNARYILSGHQ